MKKVLIVITMLGLLMGCTGLNVNTATSLATDTAFVLALQNNPQHKPAVVLALLSTKEFLKGSVTYDGLITEISKQFTGKYAAVGLILAGYIAADKPLIESNMSMLDSYKAGVIKKIDHFLVLAG